MLHFNDFREVPPDIWRWKNFTPREIACHGTGSILIDVDALDRLQALREDVGRPMTVLSAYRSPEHNAAIGGGKRSQHLIGKAFDIAMSNQDPAEFLAAAQSAGFTGFGFYPKRHFMHIDTGRARTWGKPFPAFAHFN